MTACTTVREELLEAPPDELAGVAQTPLAAHLRECPRCGPIARLLLDEHARLGGALAVIQPNVSADAATDQVLGTAEPGRAGSRRRRAGPVRRFVAAAFPMAAAAAIAAYFVYGAWPDRPTTIVASSIGVEEPADEVRVTAPADGGAIVLNTTDENITLVWLTQREITP
jgi:hypothetical protein